MRTSTADNIRYRSYAGQTLDITRMRGMLEDESSIKRQEMMKAVKEENLRLVKL